MSSMQHHLESSVKVRLADSTGSATNPHPDGYLEARLAAELDSSTRPHPDGYLEARLAAELDPSTRPHPDSYLEARLAGEEVKPDQATDENEPQALLTIQSLPLDDVSAETRLIVSPAAGITSGLLSRSEGATAFRFPHTSSDVLVVQQSSKTAYFSLNFGSLACTFFYDARSDDIVLQNLSQQGIRVVRIKDDNNTGQDEWAVLVPRAIEVIRPGPWRILEAKEEPEILTDFLLLRRRYVLGTGAAAPGAAGLKRKDVLSIAGPSKRLHLGAEATDQSLVFFHSPPQSSLMAQTALTVVKAGNPLVDLRPGDLLTIRTLAGSHSSHDTDQIRISPVLASQTTTEDYSISHLRDIAINKGFASVFRGSHPVFGNTVVKVIRTRRIPQAAYIPKIARDWQNEERCLRRMDHPSIIKFFASDARLYSIYMEYLPYPDLAAWRERTHGHYFAGTDEDAARTLRDMASALDYLCNEAILHNDIKPSNILYDRGRGPVLIDFGLASAHGDPPCKGGTPWYVPDEATSLSIRGIESDVFALGVTLLYLLRKIPLPDATEQGWIIADAASDELHKRWLNKIVNIQNELAATGVELLVSKTLMMVPEQRVSAREMLQLLEDFKVIY